MKGAMSVLLQRTDPIGALKSPAKTTRLYLVQFSRVYSIVSYISYKMSS